MGCSLSAASIKHAGHVGPEATALPSVKPRDTNAPRRWKSQYGTEGIKEPALGHVCALCVWICVEMVNLCLCLLYFTGFFAELFSKSSVTSSTQQQEPTSLLLKFSSRVLLHKERCENPVVFGVHWRFSFGAYLE